MKVKEQCKAIVPNRFAAFSILGGTMKYKIPI
jgi:hypothetical protein